MPKHYLNIDKVKQKALSRVSLQKDLVHNTTIRALGNKPLITSIKNKCSFVYDQGNLGSCTANAFCAAYCILQNVKFTTVKHQPSRLFLYFYERLIEEPTHNIAKLTDSGADVINGVDYVKKNGICSEINWPYNIAKYNLMPPVKCNVDATTHKISNYHTLPLGPNLLSNIKIAINNSTPVLVAMAVYESFESDATAKTGSVTMPKPTEACLGGHEMCIVGYTDDKKLFTVLNSWGAGWGSGGFCYIPYDYFTNHNLAFEFVVFNL